MTGGTGDVFTNRSQVCVELCAVENVELVGGDFVEVADVGLEILGQDFSGVAQEEFGYEVRIIFGE